MNGDSLKNQQGNLIIILGVFILILFVGLGAYFLGASRNRSETLLPAQTPVLTDQLIINHDEPSPAPSKQPLPSVKKDYQQYVNNKLGYGFDYLNSDTLYRCTDIPCLSIERISLRVEALSSYNFDQNNIEKSLTEADLYCSADGAGGSISCKDQTIEEFTNSSGLKGYKVLRTKTITGIGAGYPAGSYKDIAYVYLLANTKNSMVGTDYIAVLFSVDLPSEKNLSELFSISDTFFLL